MDEASFLQAISAAPGDQSLRYAYADWLEERGDARGELIRVVDEMAKLPVATGAWRRLHHRREQLRADCDVAWLKAILRPSCAQIRERVEAIDRAGYPDRPRYYGSNRRGFDPPASLEEVERIEAELGHPLPDQYRQFILECGDGGEGPGTGIRSLGSLTPNDRANLAVPFPEEGRGLAHDLADPPGAFRMNIESYLIVSGPNRGEVWNHYDIEPWLPLRSQYAARLWSEPDVDEEAFVARRLQEPRSHRLEFIDWYAEWLDGALWSVSSSNTPEEELLELPASATEATYHHRNFAKFPAALRNCKKLKRISFCWTGLRELPDWLGELTELEELDLVYNELVRLPESIGQLSRLRVLRLSQNRIYDLPKSLEQLTSLEELHLSGNDLLWLPQEVGRLPALAQLSLDGMPDLDLPSACRTLASAGALRSLSLQRNSLDSLPPEIGLLTQLSTLNVEMNDLRRLPDELAALTNLQSFLANGIHQARLSARQAKLLSQLPTASGVSRQWSTFHDRWEERACFYMTRPVADAVVGWGKAALAIFATMTLVLIGIWLSDRRR